MGGGYQQGFGLFDGNKGYFTDLQSWVYWSWSEYAAHDIYNGHTWGFNFYYGNQHVYWPDTGSNYALAVRSGDAAAAPLPGTVLLLGPALVEMVGGRRKISK
jgi:hypothetical protein